MKFHISNVKGSYPKTGDWYLPTLNRRGWETFVMKIKGTETRRHNLTLWKAPKK